PDAWLDAARDRTHLAGNKPAQRGFAGATGLEKINHVLAQRRCLAACHAAQQPEPFLRRQPADGLVGYQGLQLRIVDIVDAEKSGELADSMRAERRLDRLPRLLAGP